MERLFLKYLLVMPPDVARLASIENFRYCTLLHLLAAPDLTLISVWSPTFLISLISSLDPWQDRLADDLVHGRASLPEPGESSAGRRWRRPRCDRKHAHQVRSILRSDASLAEKLAQLWPNLDLISCWADSAAATYIGGLRTLFPAVAIQPKGLLATEACVSFPLGESAAGALALRSHFFEFLAPSGEVRLAHQLDSGGRYEVVVTTGGGLYRYRLRDVVEVVGFENECPLLKFVERVGRGSDLVGEKLHESHVEQVLRQAFQRLGVTPQFAMLAPVATPPGYRLYVEADNHQTLEATGAAVLGEVEAGLRRNPHYRYAVELGQLRPLDLWVAHGGQSRLWQTYERILLARGQKCGEIKPAVLDSWTGWATEFARASKLRTYSFSSPVK